MLSGSLSFETLLRFEDPLQRSQSPISALLKNCQVSLPKSFDRLCLLSLYSTLIDSDLDLAPIQPETMSAFCLGPEVCHIPRAGIRKRCASRQTNRDDRKASHSHPRRITDALSATLACAQPLLQLAFGLHFRTVFELKPCRVETLLSFPRNTHRLDGQISVDGGRSRQSSR